MQHCSLRGGTQPHCLYDKSKKKIAFGNKKKKKEKHTKSRKSETRFDMQHCSLRGRTRPLAPA